MENREVWICECPGSRCMHGDDPECMAYNEWSADFKCRTCGKTPVRHDIDCLLRVFAKHTLPVVDAKTFLEQDFDDSEPAAVDSDDFVP